MPEFSFQIQKRESFGIPFLFAPYSVSYPYSKHPYYARGVEVCKQWHISPLCLGVSIKDIGWHQAEAAFSQWQDAAK